MKMPSCTTGSPSTAHPANNASVRCELRRQNSAPVACRRSRTARKTATYPISRSHPSSVRLNALMNLPPSAPSISRWSNPRQEPASCDRLSEWAQYSPSRRHGSGSSALDLDSEVGPVAPFVARRRDRAPRRQRRLGGKHQCSEQERTRRAGRWAPAHHQHPSLPLGGTGSNCNGMC